MCTQHSIEKEANQEQGIVVPLELEGPLQSHLLGTRGDH
jgi:hypothetical protein